MSKPDLKRIVGHIAPYQSKHFEILFDFVFERVVPQFMAQETVKVVTMRIANSPTSATEVRQNDRVVQVDIPACDNRKIIPAPPEVTAARRGRAAKSLECGKPFHPAVTTICLHFIDVRTLINQV